MTESRTPRCIAVEGPIGVGKTSLARRIATSLSLEAVLEPGFDNPFLERYYRDGQQYALQTQLYFLLKRGEQLRQLSEPDLFRAGWVSDFVLEKDALFAELTLAPDEHALYTQVYRHMAARSKPPDLVIYLQAPVDTLLQRIRQRGLLAEQRITREYLGALCDSYTEFFHYYDRSTTLIVNAGDADFVNNESHYSDLLERVVHARGPREYYNPQPRLI